MRCWASILVTLVACGRPKPPVAPTPTLDPVISAQAWFRAPTICAQGPFELALPAAPPGPAAKWGEDVALRVVTPRAIALEALILADGVVIGRRSIVVASHGAIAGPPANHRCVADARERLALGRATSDGEPPSVTGVSSRGGEAGPSPPSAVHVALEPDPEIPASSVEVLRARPGSPTARVVIQLWSVEPNDLDGVVFGAARRRVAAERGRRGVYEAYLAQLAAKTEADAARMIAEAEAQHVEVHAHGEAHWEGPSDGELEIRRRAEIAEVERARVRAVFCAAHHDDRDCWGPGGFALHAELDQRVRERSAYCADHIDDARCWSDDESARRHEVWDQRVTAALAPPRQPDGPPPAPLAETIPPKLSLHAEWRPGYWQWTDATWVWLAGMWRVPESDILAEDTTKAPTAPPPPRIETPPAAQVRGAVWIPGFLQTNGAAWVWIGGSWQLRPTARVVWRTPEWRSRGAVHVLIPGGWVPR